MPFIEWICGGHLCKTVPHIKYWKRRDSSKDSDDAKGIICKLWKMKCEMWNVKNEMWKMNCFWIVKNLFFMVTITESRKFKLS